MESLKEFFTPKELAQKTGRSMASIWRYLREGKIAAHKISQKTYLIPKIEFNRWLQKTKTTK